jgi:hypothetical protein
LITDKLAPAGPVPLATKDIYVVLTAADIDQGSGFCSSYCSWRKYDSTNRIAYIWGESKAPCAINISLLQSPNPCQKIAVGCAAPYLIIKTLQPAFSTPPVFPAADLHPLT